MRHAAQRLLVLSLLLSTSIAGASHHRRHARLKQSAALRHAAPPPATENAGVRLDFAAPISLVVAPTFFDRHATVVRHDLLYFKPSLLGSEPFVAGVPEAVDPVPAAMASFAPAPSGSDPLWQAREYDRLLLLRNRSPSSGDGSLGFALFAAAMTMSAHAPSPMRFLFDGPVHVGPAIFEGGGMGTGIGGSVR